MMFRLLIYFHATGTFSYRRIETLTHQNFDVHFFAADNVPIRDGLIHFGPCFVKVCGGYKQSNGALAATMILFGANFTDHLDHEQQFIPDSAEISSLPPSSHRPHYSNCLGNKTDATAKSPTSICAPPKTVKTKLFLTCPTDGQL
jgi:hypothetical protein